MAHGLFGYAVDLDLLESSLGSGDAKLASTLHSRFAEPIDLNRRWFETHGRNQNYQELTDAINQLIYDPPAKFDDLTTNIGYALEILSYHLGEPIRIGRGGRSALRDVTLAEITEILEDASIHTGPNPLDSGETLAGGMLVRPIGGITNLAAYPGTGFIRRNEVSRIAADLMNTSVPGEPAQHSWYPFAKLVARALECGLDLVTFYY